MTPLFPLELTTKPKPDQSPFSLYVQNIERSPLTKPPLTRQLTFQDEKNDLGIQDIIQSSVVPKYYPRISREFQEERVCKKLDFAQFGQRSPLTINKIEFIQNSPLPLSMNNLTAKKPQGIYNSPRIQLQFNEFNTEQRNRWNPWSVPRQAPEIDSEEEDQLECEEEDDLIDGFRDPNNAPNICSHCHNSYQKSPHREDLSHHHSISFGDHSLLASQRKPQFNTKNMPEVQLHDSHKKYKHLSLITLKKKPSSNIIEKKSEPSQFNRTQEHRRHRPTEPYQYQSTVRKRPRKGSVNPVIVSIAKPDIKCNCNKSKCLKLYCDCFAAGQLCGKDCNCCDCSNNDEHNHERRVAMKQILDRNPNAFRPKVSSGQSDDDVKHFKGCNCKKSNCLKKYCECYQMGVKCSELCKCDGCKNCDSPQQNRKKSRYRYDEVKDEPIKQKRMKI